MSNTNLLTVIGVSTGVVALFLLGAYFKYKKVDIKGVFTKLKSFLEDAETYTKSLEEIATGKVQKALNYASLLEKLGETAINYAEQLLISGQITDDTDGTKRKETALSYIYAFLEKEDIKIDDSIKTIATGIIESGVLSNKTIEQINKQLDTLVNEKLVSLQKEKEELQTKLNSSTNENTTLKTTIATLQNKLSTVQNTVSTNQTTATNAQADIPQNTTN